MLEFVEGQPLKGPLAAEEAIKLALQIAGALEEAHGYIVMRQLHALDSRNPVGTVRDLGIGSGTGSDAEHINDWYWVQCYSPELDQRRCRHLNPSSKSVAWMRPRSG